MKKKVFLLITVILSLSASAYAQLQFTNNSNPALLNKIWPAKWITSPDISGKEFGIYLFRKKLAIHSKAKQFIIHVSSLDSLQTGKNYSRIGVWGNMRLYEKKKPGVSHHRYKLITMHQNYL